MLLPRPAGAVHRILSVSFHKVHMGTAELLGCKPQDSFFHTPFWLLNVQVVLIAVLFRCSGDTKNPEGTEI